jgi:ankyrin repeat protein
VSLDAVALLRLLLLQHDYSHTVDNDLLIAAARSSSNGCAELLLQHGASPNAIGFGALTALHFALQRRNTVLAQLLLMTSDCMLIATNCLLEAGTRAAPADDL